MTHLTKKIEGNNVSVKGDIQYDHQTGWLFINPIVEKNGERLTNEIEIKTVLSKISSEDIKQVRK